MEGKREAKRNETEKKEEGREGKSEGRQPLNSVLSCRR